MKPQLYILEGPDAAGKSTLATNIADHNNGQVFRCTWSPKLGAAIVPYFDSVLDNAKECLARGRSMVIDRHWPSEWVYGNLQGRETMSNANASRLDGRIKEMGGVYVLCGDDTRAQVARHAKMRDPSHPYDDAFYTRVVGGYWCWWNAMLGTTPIYRYQLLAQGGNLARFVHDLESDTNDRIYFPSAPLMLPVAIDVLDRYTLIMRGGAE